MKLTEELRQIALKFKNFANHYKDESDKLSIENKELKQKLEKIKEWLNDPEIKWVEDYDFEILRKILDDEMLVPNSRNKEFTLSQIISGIKFGVIDFKTLPDDLQNLVKSELEKILDEENGKQ